MTHYQKGGWLLLLALLLRSTLGGAQSAEAVVNDLPFVLGGPVSEGQNSTREQVAEKLQTFAEDHALDVWLTLLEEEGQYYQDHFREQESHRLQASAPILVITCWHHPLTKVRRRTQVQLNPALATRLPLATAEQIITEALDYYRTVPLPEEALRQGLSLALHRLAAYLNGLPPAGEVPPITFANPVSAASPPLGLDQPRYPAHRSNYEQTKIRQEDYPVAWKALPSNQLTTVLAQVEKDLSFPPGVVFKQNGSSVPTQPGSANHEQQLTLSGQAHEQAGSVEVYASAEEDAELVGKLNTISYDALPKKLVLISLDDAIVHNGAEMQAEAQRARSIFAQAGVQLNITTEDFRTTWGDRDTPLEDNTTGMLSNYPKQLRQVIKDYRQARQEKAEKETAYIFLAGSGTAERKGYMPKKRAYGFVFVHEHTARESLARTIAHELGHGWFRLKHSWQSYPLPGEGQTDNLMDYGKGTALRKYQWDLIHDPVGMLGWFQDEEDVSSYGDPYAYLWREVDALTSEINYSIYKFNKWVESSKRSILALFDFSDIELTSSEGKIYEILTAIQENDSEALKECATEKIITGQDLQLGEVSYDQLIIYLLRTPEAIDLKNYRTEDKVEDDYSLLIFITADELEREVLKIQVARGQRKSLEAYLFGKEEENETEADPECPSNFCCTKCGRDLTVSLERLKEIFTGNLSITQNHATHFNEALRDGGFTTCKQHAHLFSQSIVESNNFTDFTEGYRYRLKSIYSTFGGQTGNNSYETLYNQSFWDDEIYLDYIGSNNCQHLYRQKGDNEESVSFKSSDETVTKSRTIAGTNYEISYPKSFSSDATGNYIKANISNASQNGERLFNLVYENKNGNNQAGDGWRYRGRGIIQVTGRGNYKNASDKVNEVFTDKSFDWENNPGELATDNEAIIYSAVGWFLNNFSPITDLDSKTSYEVTESVNAKSLEADRRNTEFNRLINDENLYQCDED